MTRLKLLLVGMMLGLVGVSQMAYATQQDDLSDDQVMEILAGDRPQDAAISRALAWMREQALPGGSWSKDKHKTVMTAFGLMAHLAAGIDFQDSDHCTVMRSGLQYILQQQEANGYFGNKDGSRMYGHGVVTLLLSESLGMAGDPILEEQIRSALQKAIDLTVNAARVKKDKKHAGGWRYHPDAKDSDLSLSGWQLLSLASSQQIGITVPEKVIRNACNYAERLTDKDGKVGYDRRGDDKPALRGLGMLSFAIAGRQDEEIVDAIADRIEKNPIEWKGPWFFYRVYYDSVGLNRCRPERWDAYKKRVFDILVEHQDPAGHWGKPPGDNESGHGQMYTTAMAVLALAVDRHVLPIYQH